MPNGASLSPLALGQEWPLRLAFGLAMEQSQMGLHVRIGMSHGGPLLGIGAKVGSPLESQEGLGLCLGWDCVNFSQPCSCLLGTISSFDHESLGLCQHFLGLLRLVWFTLGSLLGWDCLGTPRL
mgnify:FL=1